jgi:two-component system response regulator FixJ
MRSHQKIALIDSNLRRRAQLTVTLAGAGIHADPFEDVDEVRSLWPDVEAFLVEDENDALDEIFELMAHRAEWVPTLVFSERPTTDRIVRAIHMGAANYFETPLSAPELKAAIAEAGQANAALASYKLRQAMARSRLDRLTVREREILAFMTHGLSNRMIGERLKISPRTVEIHRANLLAKIDAAHSSEAIRVAVEAALVA